jgi:hypothetical protein
MPTADSFATLGRGNGFSQCLTTSNLSTNNVILNPPTLEQTMLAYWNIDSISFGGAAFDPSNEPKDLICTPTANVGENYNILQDSSTRREHYLASIRSPKKVEDVASGEINYVHGIYFEYSNYTFNTGTDMYTDVIYRSSYYNDNESAYSCYLIDHGGGNEREATEVQLDVSEVTIEGIPFVKTVSKSFYSYGNSASSSCPSSQFNSATTLEPSLTFHTYS